MMADEAPCWIIEDVHGDDPELIRVRIRELRALKPQDLGARAAIQDAEIYLTRLEADLRKTQDAAA